MITIIFGNPGCGKTSLLTALACESMTTKAHDNLLCCKREVEALIMGGHNNLIVPKQHITFCNYNVFTEPKRTLKRQSYYVDPKLIAVPNPFFKPFFFPPYAQVFITEAQRYYYSRRSNKANGLPEPVSEWFASHRHNGHNVFLDCQRSSLIDLNIRSLAEEFILPYKMEHKTDRFNNLLSTIWHCYIFNSWDTAEKFTDTKDKSIEHERRQYEYTGNIFNCYDSFFCKMFHFRDRRHDTFDLQQIPSPSFSVEDIKEYNDTFGYDFKSPLRGSK